MEKTVFSQFFCHHIFKVDRKEFLRTRNFILMDKSDIYHPFKKVYDYYAVFKSCVICGKEKVTEERELHGSSQSEMIVSEE